jgi:TM2 domain-containing membrane protein YozV
MAYYPPPGQYPPPQQPYYPQPPDNTDTVAMILEIVFGLFGIMGMGWLYAGNILTAVLIFIGFMIFVLVEAALIAITGGLCSCVALPANIGIAIFSATRVRDYVRRTRSRGSVMYVIIAGIIGLVVVGGLVVGLILLLVAMGLVGSLSAGSWG